MESIDRKWLLFMAGAGLAGAAVGAALASSHQEPDYQQEVDDVATEEQGEEPKVVVVQGDYEAYETPQDEGALSKALGDAAGGAAGGVAGGVAGEATRQLASRTSRDERNDRGKRRVR
jgi:hypothetical protein